MYEYVPILCCFAVFSLVFADIWGIWGVFGSDICTFAYALCTKSAHYFTLIGQYSLIFAHFVDILTIF